jgi:hypothetical protein
MASESERPTLAEHLGRAQIGRLAHKKLFGRYEVPLLQFLPVGLWLFGKGAIFGRARHDKLEIVAQMFVGLEAVGVLLAPLGLSREAGNSPKVFGTDEPEYIFCPVIL